LPGRRLAGCRPDRHAPGGDDGHESETPHFLARSWNMAGSMTTNAKSLGPGVRPGQCSNDA
jgi:hypothetical protein